MKMNSSIKAADMAGAMALANQAAAQNAPAEHIENNIWTQVIVQWLQALSLVPALGAICYGLWLIGNGLAWMVVNIEGPLDWLAVVIGLTVAAIVGRRAGNALTANARRLLQLGAEVALTAAAVLCAGEIMAGIAHAWQWQEWVRLVGGLAAFVAGSALFWRFGNELMNPLFPEGPAIKLMRTLIDRWFGEAPEPGEKIMPYPVHMGGKLQDVQYAASDEAEQAEQDNLPTVASRFADLVAFLQAGARRGLSRTALVTQPRLVLPSGARLTAGVWKAMIALAADWHIVQPGGDGLGADWLVDDPDAAIAMLRAIVDEIRAGGQLTGQAD